MTDPTKHSSLHVRLRRRLPVRLRRYWKTLLASALALGLSMTVFGSVSVHPYTTSSNTEAGSEVISHDVAGKVDLFNDDIKHEVSLNWSAEEYNNMLDEYFKSREKDWIRADMTIDGTRIESVAVRLKGNSTLMSLTDDRKGTSSSSSTKPQRRGPGVALPVSKPENLPLLVSFEEYEPGRSYQGRTEVSVRPTSTTYRTVINEALGLQLTRESGQSTQDYAYATYKVNDRPTTTRLIVENPDVQYANDLDGEGVLYKVLATSAFKYKGDDQTDYVEDFKQVNLEGSQDLRPIVSFLRWLDEASDNEFEADLDQWVDVKSLAEYISTQDLLDNFDSLSGPGRNGYLWYDLDSGLISVISWDLNLTFGAVTGMFGGGAAAGAGQEGQTGQAPGGSNTDAKPSEGAQPPEGMEMPEGMEPPEGMDIPEGMEMPEGMEPPEGMEMPEGMKTPAKGRKGQGGIGGGNALLTRFKASSVYKKLIEQAKNRLQKTWYDSGKAQQALTQIAQTIPTSDGLSRAQINEDRDRLRKQVTTVGKK